ncbi:unnamed protein product [Caretta caretta]
MGESVELPPTEGYGLLMGQAAGVHHVTLNGIRSWSMRANGQNGTAHLTSWLFSKERQSTQCTAK